MKQKYQKNMKLGLRLQCHSAGHERCGIVVQT